MTDWLADATPDRVARSTLVDRLRLALLWLLGLSGGFVLIEPSPYEFVIALAIALFFAAGLSVRIGHLPLLFLLIVYIFGHLIGTVPVLAFVGTVKWTLISCFMAVSSMFFALALSEDTERRLAALLKGYVLAAVIVSLIGMLAYFHLLPSSETFLLYGRAKSTFKDPNVLGPFLVLPGLILLQAMVFGRLREFVWGAVPLLMIAGGLFFTFSRAAWGHFGASAAVMLALCYVTTRSLRTRFRIVVLTLLAAGALALLIAALLSIPQVASLFHERASLRHDYDSGETGRFGRHILGAVMMLDYPIGIGPLQFHKFFPEDPHNSFLAAFVVGGWLGGVAFFALVLVSLVTGLRYAFVPTPFQASYIAVYATFVVEVAVSYIIDVHHWRHFFLVLGVLWGLIVASNASLRRMRAAR